MERLFSDFHRAIREGDEPGVRLLLADGVDPNEPDWCNNGRPPLVEALRRGHRNIVKLLVEHGADPTSSNAQGETALHFSLQPEVFSKEIVELLIRKSPNLNSQEKFNGFSVLHVAAKTCVSSSNRKLRTEMLEVLRLLCDRGDINLRSNRGETALHRVASGALDWTEPAKVLIGKGVDLDAQNERGETSLMCAIDNGHVSIAKLLAQSGCDVNIGDRHSQTALHRCAQKNALELLLILLKRGANVNVTDLNGDTALHIAASKGLEEMVHVLVYQPRTNVNAKNLQGLTPLCNAVESGFTKVVQELLEAECEIDSDGDDLFVQGKFEDLMFARTCHPQICLMLRDAIEKRKDWDVGETSL